MSKVRGISIIRSIYQTTLFYPSQDFILTFADIMGACCDKPKDEGRHDHVRFQDNDDDHHADGDHSDQNVVADCGEDGVKDCGGNDGGGNCGGGSDSGVDSGGDCGS